MRAGPNPLASFAASVALALSCTQTDAQVAGPYTPEQVYYVLYDAIRATLGVPVVAPNQSIWLSLSTVGSVVNTDEPAHINDLANFCPEASPVITAYVREPRLDAVYSHLIESTVSPVRQFSQDYKNAKAYLYGPDGQPTAKLKKYQELELAHIAAFAKYLQAKDPASRSLALTEMHNAEVAWSAAGYRAEVDKAEDTMFKEERSGPTELDRFSGFLRWLRCG